MPAEDVRRWCQRWKVAEVYLFGSALHGEPEGESDVDLVTRKAIEQSHNEVRRQAILESAALLDVA